uniref:Uncharacterized protein n=1 Tax=Aplanochytrium stocchinoi TaxID=215587 RepID=A0A7S3PJ71_9STRA|mmetsp:Transcript_24967/g.30506  ORF Transcript_24967/g.30506 Transcript_24967/m.30506 type:complete len:118 (+) Transcript_24967:115-468(+)
MAMNDSIEFHRCFCYDNISNGTIMEIKMNCSLLLLNPDADDADKHVERQQLQTTSSDKAVEDCILDLLGKHCADCRVRGFNGYNDQPVLCYLLSCSSYNSYSIDGIYKNRNAFIIFL